MFLVALLVILLWCIVFALRSWMKPRHPSPPVYPGALPFIGHGLMMVIGGSQKMWKIEKKVYEYSLQKEEVVEFRLGPHSVYVISDPDDCLTVANTCLEKPYLYNFMKPMYNKGLVTLDSSTWKAHRKLLNPSFNQQVLQAFVPEYCTQAKYLVAQLASKVRKGPFDLQPYLIRNLLKTVCRTTLGLNTDEHSETVKTYAHVTEDFLNSILHRVQRVWLHLPYIFNKTSYKKKQDLLVKMLKDLTKQVIVNRKSELKEMKNLHKISEPASDTFKPLIDQLLQLADKKDVFTDEEIRDHLDTIVAAAYDTTASSLLFTFIFIGSHQDVQERMYKELQEVLGNEDRDLNRSDLSKLVYTEAVIKESLRLLPPVPRIMRCSTSGIKLKHYTLPASCTYLISLYASNRHPMWGADAELFRPERWLDPATLPANPNAFASFGLGRRNCIGKVYGMMAMKTNLAYIVHRYRIKSDIKNFQMQCDVLLKAVEGHHVDLELRD